MDVCIVLVGGHGVHAIEMADDDEGQRDNAGSAIE